MRDAKLPIQYRDNCASLLIPLNRCRFETYYLPWKCEVREQAPHRACSRRRGPTAATLAAYRSRPSDENMLGAPRRAIADRIPQQERHTYEKCQYVEFKKRVAKMDELRAAKGGARSN